MTQCCGLARNPLTAGLTQCERECFAGETLCYWCKKIADGLITTIDGKTGLGHELSWKPLLSQQVSADLASKLAAIANHEERKQMLSDLSNLVAK